MKGHIECSLPAASMERGSDGYLGHYCKVTCSDLYHVYMLMTSEMQKDHLKEWRNMNVCKKQAH